MSWKMVTIGNICKVNPLKPESIEGSWKVSFVPMQWVSEKTRTIEKEETRLFCEVSKGYTPFSRGDVLLAKITPCFENGKVAIADIENDHGFGSSEFHVVRPLDNSVTLNRFVYYCLQSPFFVKNASRNMTGSAGQKRVPKKFLESYKIPLPPLETQKRIIELLDLAQVLIDKRKEQIGLMDKLTHSLFHDMFGDPVMNSMGWDLLRFEQVCSSRLGKMLDKKKELGEHQKQYLRNANVKWFSFELNEIYSMDFLSGELEKFKLKYGDILICEGGEPGRAAIWKDKVSECYYQKALHRARIIGKKAAGEYIVYLFWYFSKNGGFKDHISSATIAHLTGEKLKKMAIPVPPVDLQNTFAERVQKIEAQKEAMTVSLHELEDNFNSLMQRAFKGEI